MSIFETGITKNDPLSVCLAMQLHEKSKPEEPVDFTETAFFESVTEDQMLESVQKSATQSFRSQAASAVVQWIDEGDTTFDELDALLHGLAAGEDDELDDDEAEDYQTLQDFAGEFLVSLGAKDSQVQSMVEDDDAAEAVFNAVEEALKGKDEDELIAEFAVRETMMMEAVKKVIRDGEVKYIKTNRRKRRMTSAQKAALKKARRKANTASAKAARRKAMRKRKSMGMK